MSKTVIVGDVHGCRDELQALLEKVGFTSGDKLVSVGDILVRGPNPLGVLDIVRQTGAVVVRGNHEQKLLNWRHDPNGTNMSRAHFAVAEALRPADWALLEATPLYYALPEHGIVVVHAGVVPGVPLESQSPDTLLRVRSLDANGKPSDKPGKPSWSAVYEGPPHVVFGHHASAGLQLDPWATGLDTGCVYGGRLTALVLRENDAFPAALSHRESMIISEPARRVYYEHKKAD